MRICFIYPANLREGQANSISMLKNVAAAQWLGHEVTLVMQRGRLGAAEAAELFERRLNDSSIRQRFPLIRIPRLTLWGRGQRSFSLLAGAWAALWRFDLLWSSDIYAGDIASALGVPTIIELHKPLTARQRPVARRMVRRRSLRAFVAISERLRRILARDDIPSEKIVTAHSAVDLLPLDELRQSSINAKLNLGWPEQPTVVYSGSLYPGRGIEQIIEAAVALGHVRFVCIGGRDFEIERFRLAVRIQGASNLVFVGYVPNRDIAKYLLAADILVAPYNEQCEAIDGQHTIDYASPMKLFEYLAAGRPIVTSSIGAIPEIITHEHNGLLTSAGDSGELVAAIDRLLNDRELAVRISEMALHNSRQYSWEKRVEQILAYE